RDNGTGIPDDAMDKIFNPFYTTKPSGTGVGLGLSFCNDVVRQYGGSITAESEPGEFTEMTIRLPAVRD
ncbi:MAG: HAMP domain-containing histidine kinase, partial [Acidimicrobiaceae bacterium]|nr:HAMP domain-containing histidine kinase [Acidimicrobiaceae bacterium]